MAALNPIRPLVLGLRSSWSAWPLQTLRERDHRDGTNIGLLRQEVAQELTELAFAQGDHCFFHLDDVTLLRRGR